MARRHGNGELRVAVREGVGKGSGEGCRQLALKRLYEGVPPCTRGRGPRHCGCGGMPPHEAGRPCCGVLRGLRGRDVGFAWELANPREVVPVPVKGIVAPWPWRGPELTLCPGWHDRNVLDD